MTREAGFTLIEVMAAIVILSVGVLGLAASTGAITRTLTGSRNITVATQVALRRMEMLRTAASSTKPRCTAAAFTGSAAAVTVVPGYTEQWRVDPTGTFRRVLVIVTYRVGGGRARTDTLATHVHC